MHRLRIFCRRLLAVGAALLIFPASPLQAWGDRGHEIIGGIAYARLAPSAKQQVDGLLAADRDNLTVGDFVSRTTWADKYRDSDRNTTRVRYEATRTWHFINIEIRSGKIDPVCARFAKLPPATAASVGPAKACLIDKIEQFIAELRRPSTARSERILALKYLLHLVGDLHQPLHVADNNDRGGNDVPVLVDGIPTNLHAYWDTQIVDHLGGDSKAVGIALNKAITAAAFAAWSRGTPRDWAMDSFQEGKRSVYDFTTEKRFKDERGARGFHLGASYDNRARPVARRQLSKAGVRLAAVLNDAFK